MWWTVLLLLISLTLPASAQWPRSWVTTSCVLSWTAPTTNTDASALTDLHHFRVCVSPTQGGSCSVANVSTANASTVTATCAQLNMVVDPNPYWVRVYAVDASSNESAVSNEIPVTVTTGRTMIRK